jgi:hypothetical protein
MTTEPKRARAVFSNEDFTLLKTAITHYIKTVETGDETAKYSNLYHRLGRVG